MSVISALRYATYELLLQNLKNNKREYQEIASAADQVRVEYAGRFLIELLQNAADAAQKAGLTDSTVKIIRTGEAVYVANQGEPFEQRGIDYICSLGLTTKDAASYIGNKGIGFKSVLEVTSAPSICSGRAAPAEGYFRHAFRFDRCVHERLLDELSAFALERFAQEPELEASIRRWFPTVPCLDVVTSEFSKIAYFKLPEDLDVGSEVETDPTMRDLATDELRFATIIKLPLREDDGVADHVDRAFDQLQEEAGLTLLFTSAVERVIVRDQSAEGRSFHVSRTPVSVEQARDACFRVVRTAITHEEDDAGTRERTWLLAETRLGAAGRTSSATERSQLAPLVREFPESWRGLREAEIAVAMPVTDLSEAQPVGRYCLTFASETPTGFPFYVNGKLYGKLARKGVELAENPYNVYLVAQAGQLAQRLAEWMKRGEDALWNQLVTLVFWRGGAVTTPIGDDPLASSLLDGVELKAVVLARDGDRYLCPNETAVPAPDDTDMMIELFGSDLLAEHGFRLPDAQLLHERHDALEALVPQERRDLRLGEEALLSRSEDLSLLEAAAAMHRDAGPAWWMSFVAFIEAHFPQWTWFSRIADQRIWPIESAGPGGPRLAPARGHGGPAIFRRPRSFAIEEFEEDSAPEDDDITELPAVPLALAPHLAFLDEGCIPMTERRDGRAHLRPYTEYLTPRSRDRQLIRPPRVRALVNEIVVPFFDRFLEGGQEREAEGRAWEVLAFLYRLVTGARPGAELVEVNWDRVAVPAFLANGVRTWRRADEVYLSRQWTSLPDGQDPEALFRGLDGVAFLRGPHDVVSGLTRAGLTLGDGAVPLLARFFTDRLCLVDRPRIYRWRHELKPRYVGFDYDPPAPPREDEGFRGPWEEYFRYLARQGRQYDTTRYAYAVEIVYVDGCLEVLPENRASLFRRMLSSAEHYGSIVTSEVRKQGGEADNIEVEAFWCHALRGLAWVPCCPRCEPNEASRSSSEAVKRPSEVWILGKNEIRVGRDARYQFLSYLAPDVAGMNDRFCRVLGIQHFEDATAAELAELLSELTAYACALPASSDQWEPLRSLVHECWQKTAEAIHRGDEAPQSLASVFGNTVLLESAERFRLHVLSDVSEILVNDDQERYHFFSTKEESVFLPLPPVTRQSYPARRRLVRTLVAFDSELFTPLSQLNDKPAFREHAAPRMPLKEYLEREAFPGVPIWEHLFELYATAGPNPVDPTKDAFRRTCQSLTLVEVAFVTFAVNEWATPVFLEYSTQEGSRLLAVDPEHASPSHILMALAPMIGGVEDSLLGWYASQTRRSFSDPPDVVAAEEIVARFVRRVGEHVREEVRQALKAESEEVLDLLEPVAIAARLCVESVTRPIPEAEERIGQLRHEWASFRSSVDEQTRPMLVQQVAGEFIGRQDTVRLLTAMKSYDDRSVFAAWNEQGIPADLISMCLVACAFPPLRFSENVQLFRGEAKEFASALMATCSVHCRPASIVHQYDDVIASLLGLTPEDGLLGDPHLDRAQARLVVQDRARRAVHAAGITHLPTAVERLLRTPLGAQHLTDGLGDLLGTRVPERIVAVYFGHRLDSRQADAQHLWSEYRWALAAVLAHDGAEPDVVLGSCENELSPFLNGLWANPNVLLHRLGETLEMCYPGWDSSRNQSLFRQRLRPKDLEKWLVHGGHVTEPEPEAEPAEKTISILGQEMTEEEFEKEAALGEDGKVFSSLSVDPEFDPRSLLKVSRSTAPQRPRRKPGQRRSGGARTPRSAVRDEYIGFLGELCVYNAMRERVLASGGDPEDVKWLSRNRERFGLPEGDDGLGYDLEFSDIAGLLGGRGHTYYLEVKATTGDGTRAFQMSLDEWEVARRCEQEDDLTYVIVRVAHATAGTGGKVIAMVDNPYTQRQQGTLAVDEAGFYVWYGPEMQAGERTERTGLAADPSNTDRQGNT